MSRPFIMVPPVGARRSRSVHPVMPFATPDVVEHGGTCPAAGADALQRHTRVDQCVHAPVAGRYREAPNELARAAPGTRVRVTTGSATEFEIPAEFDGFAQTRPGWVSVSVREFAREPRLAHEAYGACSDNGAESRRILSGRDDIHGRFAPVALRISLGRTCLPREGRALGGILQAEVGNSQTDADESLSKDGAASVAARIDRLERKVG